MSSDPTQITPSKSCSGRLVERLTAVNEIIKQLCWLVLKQGLQLDAAGFQTFLLSPRLLVSCMQPIKAANPRGCLLPHKSDKDQRSSWSLVPPQSVPSR